MKRNLLLFLLLPLFFGCDLQKPESIVSFPKLISDGMVLQRDMPLKIWGKGIPNEKIRVSLAGAVGSSQVLPDSTWVVQLPPLPAGGPYDLVVNIQTIKDVYLGDVWLAGGQSNMEWPLKAGVIGAEAEFANPDFPTIRFFKVPNDYSAEEKTNVSGGQWKVANAENLPDFSAVAWFFAKQNHLEKGVPVGVIESNWGGTPAEGWTEAKVLAEIEGRSYTQEAKEVIENAEKWKADLAENEKRREMRDLLMGKPDSMMAGEVSSINYNDANWKSIQLPEANPLEHIAWVRKRFNLSSTEEVTLTLPDVHQMAFLYVNGIQIHYKDWGSPMPEVKIPGEILKQGQNVLTIRAVNAWNNKPEIGGKGMMFLTQNGKKINLEGTWTYSNDQIEPQLPEVQFHNWRPGFMFNAMIAPLTNYAIKGVIWYQGESNAGRAAEYRELFGAMITNWRARWGNGDYPFLFVQLANFMERKELQPESGWAFLREAQTQTLELPAAGMATIIDIGEAEDIHPRNKKDVGERLWLQAKKVAFGEEILASGPVFKEAKQVGNELVLSFSEVGEGLKLNSGVEVKGFIIEDAKGKFTTAKGVISGLDQVRLTIPNGFIPVGIRYAWSDNPEVNLVNELNLPTVPFRTGL
ncbi:sialate O-acetylesterase [Algoriphagus sp. A40]|uniref:sialate O-acetylesterase n=1 Tax=Algoriphagus sp. A40 TaxID=1945863 RepID=UPI0009867400|nr:sialate O-acetylesterase [Algoriphagus sp. A40]OOG74910.1 sialate O-acetylesterase [Algoriphagus sp. A40]